MSEYETSFDDKIIKLNIGGTMFHTTKKTLTNTPEPNYFHHIFSERWNTLFDENGCFFIDRNGEYFKPILNYLRTGILSIPEKIPQYCVFLESDFYNIDLINIGFSQGILHEFKLNNFNDYQTSSTNDVIFPFKNKQISRHENNHRIYDIDISDAFDIISKNPKYAIIEKKDNYFTCVPLHRIKTKFSVKLNCYFYYI